MTVQHGASMLLLLLVENLPEPNKAAEFMRKFSSILRTDQRVRQTTLKLTAPDCQCANAEDYVVTLAWRILLT